MKKSFRKTIIILFSFLVALSLCVVWFFNGITEYYSAQWVSKSIAESKSKGAFLRKANVIPKAFQKYNTDIDFDECWIEEQTRIEYSWLFIKHYIGTGKYILCFTIKNKYSPLTWITYFFVDEDGHAFGRHGTAQSGVFEHSIDKTRSGRIKLSFVKGWKDKRDTSITIVLD